MNHELHNNTMNENHCNTWMCLHIWSNISYMLREMIILIVLFWNLIKHICFRGGGGGNVHWIGSLLTYYYVTNLLDVQLVAKGVCVCGLFWCSEGGPNDLPLQASCLCKTCQFWNARHTYEWKWIGIHVFWHDEQMKEMRASKTCCKWKKCVPGNNPKSRLFQFK